MPLDIRTKIDLHQSDPNVLWSLNNGPEPEDPTISLALGNDYGKYTQMLKDTEVRRSLSKRKQGILGRSLIIEPGGTGRKDRKAVETAGAIANLLNYESLCNALLNKGQLIGFSVLRLDWETVDEYVIPKWHFVPQNRFTFSFHDPNNKTVPVCSGEKLDPATEIALCNGYELRILTKANPYSGERCPKDRFLIYTFDSDGSPWGLGLGYSIYPWWSVKRQAMKAWLMQSDRVGSPPTIGTTPPNLDERRPEVQDVIAKFDNFLRSISPSGWARLPAGFDAKLLESFSSASPEVHQKLIREADYQMAKVILGEVPFSDKESSSFAANKSQVEDRELNQTDADCNILDEQLQLRLWNAISRLNYPDAEPPQVHRQTASDRRKVQDERDRQDSLKSRVDRDKAMIDLGYRLKPEKVAEIYGEEYVDTSSVEADGEEKKQALVTVLGVGGTQALTGFLGQYTQAGLSRENAIAVLNTVFGVPLSDAEKIVPEDQAQEPPPDAGADTTDTTDAQTTLFNEHEFGAVIDRRLNWNGLSVGVEYLPGQVRFKNSRKLRSGYGHLVGYRWNGKAPDCWISDGLLKDGDGGGIYLVTQINPDTGNTDELKLMLGYGSEVEARSAYLREMPSADYFGGIREISIDELEQYRKNLSSAAELPLEHGYRFGQYEYSEPLDEEGAIALIDQINQKLNQYQEQQSWAFAALSARCAVHQLS